MMANIRRPTMRRAVVLLPNSFTLFNLFCGIFAIVLASRGSFGNAALFVVLGGIADALDGRVARATGTGSPFGEELDSLVDAISFGFAPAMIMFFAVLNRENWDWLFVFLFTACAVMRLARFNVEQAGRPKTQFHGLPSPAAGVTLATYYWFSQTPLYHETVIFLTDDKVLADLPWHAIMRWLMVLLGFLMVSDVPYPAVPTIGWRRPRQIVGSAIILGSIAGLILLPRQFIFPVLLAYVLIGAVKWVVLGFMDMRGEPDSIYMEEEPDLDYVPVAPVRSNQGRTFRPPPSPAAPVAATDTHTPSKRKRRRRRPRSDRGRGEQTPRPTHTEDSTE